MRRLAAWGALLLGAHILGCGDDAPQPCAQVRSWSPPSSAEALATLDGLDFDAFVDASFRALLIRDPEAVSELGLAEQLGVDHSQLTDISAEYEDETQALVAGILTRLSAFDRKALTAAQQHTYDVYAWSLEDLGRRHELSLYDYPVTHLVDSAQNEVLLVLADLHPITSQQDAEDLINRMCQVRSKVDQIIEKLRAREDADLIAPRRVLDWALSGIRDVARSSPTRLDVYRAFINKVGALPGLSRADQEALFQGAAVAVETSILPAYERLAYEVERLQPRAPSGVSVGQYPRGDEYYAMVLRSFTSTTLTADEIHTLGVQELSRIHSEMQARFDALGYPHETLAQTYARVAVDGGIVAASGVPATYEAIIEQAEGRLQEAFEAVPSASWEVIPVTYGGFYVAASLDGSRPGAFYASSGASRPRFAMPTLAYHELIPGHHFQISLAREADLPLARNLVSTTGYAEGWALYAERLVAELGWYADDPYADLGRLQWEAFRAARLVVDTGLHHLGWQFNDAVTFLRDNVGFRDDVLSAEGQIARYVAWPGQATAYTVGMLELLRLRDKAEQQLGARYDLRAFHTAVLGNGNVPLELLDGIVQEAIDATP